MPTMTIELSWLAAQHRKVNAKLLLNVLSPAAGLRVWDQPFILYFDLRILLKNLLGQKQ